MMKRSVSILLCLCMAASLLAGLAITSRAAESWLWPSASTGSWTTYDGHRGIDIQGRLNTDVRAAKSGTAYILNSTCNGKHQTAKPYNPLSAGSGGCTYSGCHSSTGKCVWILHGDGYASCYMHLNSIDSNVKNGAYIRQGDVIGKVGTTGPSTGPHLHFEISYNSSTSNTDYWSYSYKNASGTPYSSPSVTSYIYALPSASQETTLTLSGHNYPTELTEGQYYDLVGTVSCNLNITRLTVGVFDRETDGERLTGNTVSPNSPSYSIVNVDRDVKFNILSAGTYYYRITATAADGTTKQLLNQRFTVSPKASDGNYTVVMTAAEFVNCLQKALARKTKYNNNYPYNVGYYDGDTISWDCWNLGKSIIWTGGAIVDNYTVGNHARTNASCGLGDWEGLRIIKTAPNCNGDFTNLVPGEWLYMTGHIGYYVGNGQVIECTQGWGANRVIQSQIDSAGRRSLDGVPNGSWIYHGMVPWIDYGNASAIISTPAVSYTLKTGKYYIKNKATGKYLNVANGTDSNGANVQVTDVDVGYKAYKWEIGKSTSTGNNTVMIRSLKSESRVLNNYGDTVVSGNNVTLWENTQHASQRWGLQEVNGYYVIRSAMNSGVVLNADGDNARMCTFNGSDSQYWELIDADWLDQMTLSPHLLAEIEQIDDGIADPLGEAHEANQRAEEEYSAWSQTLPSNVTGDRYTIESKTMYRYCDTSNTVQYGEWGAAQTSSTRPTESDTLRIINTATYYNYYHYCCNWYDGQNNIDSISYGSGAHHYHTLKLTYELSPSSIPDKGGKTLYGSVSCAQNFRLWAKSEPYQTYEYTYQTRNVTSGATVESWSGWSDSQPAAATGRRIESAVFYRYKAKPASVGTTSGGSSYSSAIPGSLSAIVSFPRIATYFAGRFADVAANAWFSDKVAAAFEYSLMKGVSDTAFNPKGDVTVAETVAMAARIHSIFTRGSENFVQTGNWYQVYLDYAYQNGIISSELYHSDVRQKATRELFATVFAKALPDNALAQINAVANNAIPDVPSVASAAESIYKLYRAGVLTGNDARGTFSPLSNITRAEAATIVSRMADSASRVQFLLN